MEIKREVKTVAKPVKIYVDHREFMHLMNCVNHCYYMTGNEELKDIYDHFQEMWQAIIDDVPISLIYPGAIAKILSDYGLLD